MVSYVLARKSRNIASSVLHVVLNLLLGVVAVYSTVLLKTPALGIVLVLLSKWRVFAVRVRFWWPNIKANLVDLIVGVSVVLLTYYTLADPMTAANYVGVFLMAVFYCVWLTVLKPMSSEKAALFQSMAAVFLGMSAAAIATVDANVMAEVVCAFVIGYAASRHILTQGEDYDFTITTLASGLTFAETAWLCNAWAIVYPIGVMRVPQVAIILTIFTFVYNYARQAMIKYADDFRFKHILGPVLFGIILIGIIVLGFSDPIFNV